MFKNLFRVLIKSLKGFTLVEAMLIIVIAGVLTAIAVPVYNASVAKACEATVEKIDGAIQQYKADKGYNQLPAEFNFKEELKDYFEGNFPSCPGEGGEYTLDGEHAVCGDPTHSSR